MDPIVAYEILEHADPSVCGARFRKRTLAALQAKVEQVVIELPPSPAIIPANTREISRTYRGLPSYFRSEYRLPANFTFISCTSNRVQRGSPYTRARRSGGHTVAGRPRAEAVSSTMASATVCVEHWATGALENFENGVVDASVRSRTLSGHSRWSPGPRGSTACIDGVVGGIGDPRSARPRRGVPPPAGCWLHQRPLCS